MYKPREALQIGSAFPHLFHSVSGSSQSLAASECLRRIRLWLCIFIIGLFLSGVTAFPLQTEAGLIVTFLHIELLRPVAESSGLLPWLERVNEGLVASGARYPFLAYGTDWLGFGHLVIAAVFFGPYIDPIRNKWVISFGLIACAGVLPFALIAGHIRGIPVGWRLIDCSFGVLGAVPLLLCWRLTVELERSTHRACSLGATISRKPKP